MNNMDYKTKITQELQKFADGIIWSNADGSEKYLGIGNMSEWILSHALPIYRQHLIEKIEKVKEMVQRDIGSFKYNDCYDDCLEIINKE